MAGLQLLPLSLEGLWMASRRPAHDKPASLSRSVARLCFVTRGQLLEGGIASMELQLLHSGASPAPSILAGCLVRYKAEGRHHLAWVAGTAAAAAAASGGQLLLRLAASGRTLPAASLSNSSPLEADAAWEQQGRAELEELAARLAPPTCRQVAAACCRLSTAWRWAAQPAAFTAAVQRDPAGVAGLLEHAPAIEQLLACVEPGSSAAAAGGSKRSMREASPAPPPRAERSSSGSLPPPDSTRARKRRRSESPRAHKPRRSETPPRLLAEDARRADRQVPPGTSLERLLLRAVAAVCTDRPSAWQPSFELGFALRDLDRDWRKLVSGASLTELLAVLECRGHVALQRSGGTLCFRPSLSARLPPAPTPAVPSPAPGHQAQASGGRQAGALVLDAALTEERRAQHRHSAQQWEEAMPPGGTLERQLLEAVEASTVRGRPAPGVFVASNLIQRTGRPWKTRGLPSSFKLGTALWELDRRGLALTEFRRPASGEPDVYVSLRRH